MWGGVGGTGKDPDPGDQREEGGEEEMTMGKKVGQSDNRSGTASTAQSTPQEGPGLGQGKGKGM